MINCIFQYQTTKNMVSPSKSCTFPSFSAILLYPVRRILLGFPSLQLSWLGKRKKVTRSKISWIERFFQYTNIPSSQELPDAQRYCEQVHYHGEAAMIFPAINLVSFCTLSKAYAAGSPYRLTDWSSGSVARIHCGWCLSHERMGSTWLWLFCFLWP